jgi:hypothetical protein
MNEQALVTAHRRLFVGVLLKCCNIYIRAHLAPQADAYVGQCPRCATPVRIALSPEGSGRRFAKAS